MVSGRDKPAEMEAAIAASEGRHDAEAEAEAEAEVETGSSLSSIEDRIRAKVMASVCAIEACVSKRVPSKSKMTRRMGGGKAAASSIVGGVLLWRAEGVGVEGEDIFYFYFFV